MKAFREHTSSTHSMLSRSSQSIALNLIDSMDGSLAKYISMALLSRISRDSSLGHLGLPFEEDKNIGA